MNQVILSGRLTKDVEVKFTTSQMAVASFTLAVDKRTKGEEKSADFIRCKAFGKVAEFCSNYTEKGARVILHGRIATGSYQNKDGATVFTFDVIADSVEPIDWKKKEEQREAQPVESAPGNYGAPANDMPDPWSQQIDNSQLPWNM